MFMKTSICAMLIILLLSKISNGADISDVSMILKDKSLKNRLQRIDDVFKGKATDNNRVISGRIKSTNEYIKDHPEELLELAKTDFELVQTFLDREDKVSTWIMTRKADRIHTELVKQAIKQHPSWKDDYIKYYLMSKIFTRCIGSEATIELIDMKNKYDGPDYKVYYRGSDKKRMDQYPEQEEYLRKHASLYRELASLGNDDLNKFTYQTFSYAYEKRKEVLPFINEDGENTRKIPDEEKINYDYKKGFGEFFSDLSAVEKSRPSEQKEKENKAFDPTKLAELIPLLIDRGGALDLKGYHTIENIIRFASFEGGRNIDDWYEYYDNPEYGIMSLQTLIKDPDGKLRYIVSFPYGKIPPKNPIAGESEDPGFFYMAKVLYENDTPAALVATQVYANDKLKNCLRKNIFDAFNVNFTEIREDGRLARYRAYDMDKVGFFRQGQEDCVIPYGYFPSFEEEEDWLEKLKIQK